MLDDDSCHNLTTLLAYNKAASICVTRASGNVLLLYTVGRSANENFLFWTAILRSGVGTYGGPRNPFSEL